MNSLPPPGDITRLLQGLDAEGPEAAHALWLSVYNELHRIAEREMRRENGGHTLQATALVHEAYVRMCGDGRAPFRDSVHFFAVAARAMRCILVDHGRRRQALKRTPGGERVPLEALVSKLKERGIEITDLGDALDELAEKDPPLAQIFEMRYFAEVPAREIARMERRSVHAVERDVELARAWLERRLR